MRPGTTDPATTPAAAPEDAEATEPVEVPSEGTTGRRRIGFGLTLFGATGVLLFGVALAYVAGPLGGEEGPFGLESQRRQLVAMLDASATAITDAQTAVGGANDSLGDTARAAGSAGTFMTGLGTSLRGAAASLRIDLFGSRPFATVADDFERVAGQAAAVATDLESAGQSVALAGEDLAVLADDLGELRTEIDAIRVSLMAPISTGRWQLIAGAVLAWFMIPAVVSLLIGLRWLRDPARPPVPPRARRTVRGPARRSHPPGG
ncbi:MAG: hypothetical protein H0V87_02070 [Chloroflexi bacterium]|nr:hypothetical protein [Chloroflexota bacterium]